MNKRNTRQKYVILKIIKDNHHPTIAEICKEVQRIDSSIGQATVYRNIKKFVEDKKIYQIKTKSGIDRYDYYTNHIHFECTKCGNVIDIIDDELLKKLALRFENRPESIQNYNLILEGICEDCKTIYNINSENSAPQVESVCDNCGGRLYQRNDDNLASFQTRYKMYIENTEPILEHYRDKNALY